MRVISARNVNRAMQLGIDFFRGPEGVNYRKQESRNGMTREATTPVTTVYQKPWERVLFSAERDANPFFHLFESIWMLAGSNDLSKLLYFNSGMSQFSDDNQTLNGAYGHRWRRRFDQDQLTYVLVMLSEDPDTRRVVLQMWDPFADLDSPSKDIPCNTNIYFKIRDNKLQMTVCNRSNDMLWGAYGANAVHMSVLQEYIAASLELEMGPYYQVSDSFHVYENNVWDKVKDLPVEGSSSWYSSTYPEPHYPLVNDPTTFLKECENFINRALPTREAGNPEPVDKFSYDFFDGNKYTNTFFPDVMLPMVASYKAHKERNYEDAYAHLATIKAEDWQQASFHWIKRRQIKWEIKNATRS